MKRSIVAALALLACTVVAVPAFAGEKEKPQFPMAAAEFQGKVDANIAKAREHMEKRITDRKLDDTKAKEARDRFDAVVTKVEAAAANAEADGTVTKEEAKEVRQVARELGHRGHHHHKQSKSQSS
jgi:hypothetical protein